MTEEVKKEEQELEENPEAPEEGENPEEGEEEEVEKTSEQLKTENIQLEKDKKGLTEQLIVERKKKQEALALARGNKPDDPEEEEEEEKDKKDPEKIVRKVLDENRAKRQKANKLKALHKFWEKNPQFDPENDISGLKMDIVNEALERFNTINSVEVDDILIDYADALKLIKKDEDVEEDVQLDTSPGGITKSIKGKKYSLTPEQDKLRKEKGWTVDKYVEMKFKYPRVIT